MDGTLDHPVTTMGVHCIISQKPVHTEFRDQLRCIHNIANSQNLTKMQHLRALTGKLDNETKIAAQTPQGRVCIKNLQSNITKILNPSVAHDEEQIRRILEED